MKKLFIVLALILIFSCIFVFGISAKELYLEEVPEELKLENDTVTHFLVIDGEEYYGGANGTVNSFNLNKIAEEISKSEAEGGALYNLGYTAGDLGTRFLTKLVIPGTFNDATVTNVNINNNGSFKGQTYFRNCGYLEFPSSMTITHDANQCNSNIRCIDFGEDSCLTEIPTCFMNSAKNLKILKNMPKHLDTIEVDAFRNCHSLQGDENGQLYISAKTIKTKAFDNAMANVRSIIFGENVQTLYSQAFSNGEVTSPQVTYIEFKCDVTKVAFPENSTTSSYVGAFYFGKNDSQRLPYSSLTCIILSNPMQAGCDGKTFREVCGQDVFFNDIKGEDDYVYTSHAIESQNSCFEGCTRCALTQLKENPTHEGATIKFSDENGNDFSYIADIYVSTYCPVCGLDDVSEVIDKIIISKGYSVCETEGGITNKVAINHASLERYEQLSGETLYYGVVAGIKKDGCKDALVSYEDGAMKVTDNAVAFDLTDTDFTILELKITGINASATVYCNAYVFNGTAVSYICDKTVDVVAIPQEIVVSVPSNDEE